MIYPNYPLKPEISDISILKPSKEYKNEVVRVLASILLFLVVYISLIILSAIIAGVVSYLGIQLILLHPMFITIMLGLGMIGLGLMVMFFLIKFIFTDKKIDRSSFKEIKEVDFPELFDFIKKLACETRTSFPKKIYLTYDVNASVFYDSNFLSMFFPVKKNLLIGLGFVNSVNMSEFKAVIGHEFGHFSQHSMRLGSYVYNVNGVIYNMLYDNDTYAETIDSWASISVYFALFAKLTIKIVVLIQWILRQVFVLVNKSNLSLSRQMEHHADAVSAYVSGPNQLVNALKRIDIGSSCYQELIDIYNQWIDENIKPDNIYVHHHEIIQQFAKRKRYEIINGLPLVDIADAVNIQKHRLVVKDQWASHPSLFERETFLKALKIENTEKINESPWMLFGNHEKIQKELTAKMFSTIKYEGEIVQMDAASFKKKYNVQFENKSFNKEYRGFYDNRNIANFDLNDLKLDKQLKYTSFSELINEEHCALPNQLELVNANIQILKAIISGANDIKSIDFDGIKYKIVEIPLIILQLEKEASEFQEKMNELDKEIFKFCINGASAINQHEILDCYTNYFKILDDSTLATTNFKELSMEISPIYQGGYSFQEAHSIIHKVKVVENRIILHIRNLLPAIIEDALLSENEEKEINHYLSKEREYLDSSGFNNVELDVFTKATHLYMQVIFKREFKTLKVLLDKQLSVMI